MLLPSIHTIHALYFVRIRYVVYLVGRFEIVQLWHSILFGERIVKTNYCAPTYSAYCIIISSLLSLSTYMILSDGRVRFTKNIQKQNANSLDVMSFEWQNSDLSFSLTGMDMVPGKHWIWPLKAAHICTDASRHLTKIIWRSFWRYVSQNYVMRFKPVAFLLIKCQAKNKYILAKSVGSIYIQKSIHKFCQHFWFRLDVLHDIRLTFN